MKRYFSQKLEFHSREAEYLQNLNTGLRNDMTRLSWSRCGKLRRFSPERSDARDHGPWWSSEYAETRPLNIVIIANNFHQFIITLSSLSRTLGDPHLATSVRPLLAKPPASQTLTMTKSKLRVKIHKSVILACSWCHARRRWGRKSVEAILSLGSPWDESPCSTGPGHRNYKVIFINWLSMQFKLEEN